jgi:hypothetical protein
LCADDVCALQRRETPSPAAEAARSQGLSGITAASEAKRANPTAGASSAAAPVDSGTDPPPAGPFSPQLPHPTALVHSNRTGCSRCSGPRSPGRATNRAETQSNLRPPLPTYFSSSLPVQATALSPHAPMRRAVTRTALWGRLPPQPLRRSQCPRPSRFSRGRCPCLRCALRSRPCVHMHATRSCCACTLVDSITASTRLLSAARRRGVH